MPWRALSALSSAYKFQIAVSIVFHKAVVPVVLTLEMVAVYADAPAPIIDVNRQLLSFIEVYEQNGSGWVFSNIVSLQLSLWHLDPLRASTFCSAAQLDKNTSSCY